MPNNSPNQHVTSESPTPTGNLSGPALLWAYSHPTIIRHGIKTLDGDSRQSMPQTTPHSTVVSRRTTLHLLHIYPQLFPLGPHPT